MKLVSAGTAYVRTKRNNIVADAGQKAKRRVVFRGPVGVTYVAQSEIVRRPEDPMSEVLSSWKDVAAHLGKSVRTVQRWEAELGLPIHRPNKRQQRIILAYPDELKQWVGAKLTAAKGDGKYSHQRLQKATHQLAAQVRKLQFLSEVLQKRTAASLDRAQRTRRLARRASASQS